MTTVIKSVTMRRGIAFCPKLHDVIYGWPLAPFIGFRPHHFFLQNWPQIYQPLVNHIQSSDTLCMICQWNTRYKFKCHFLRKLETNFTNILWAAFANFLSPKKYKPKPKVQKSCAKDLFAKKLLVKCCWNWQTRDK